MFYSEFYEDLKDSCKQGIDVIKEMDSRLYLTYLSGHQVEIDEKALKEHFIAFIDCLQELEDISKNLKKTIDKLFEP